MPLRIPRRSRLPNGPSRPAGDAVDAALAAAAALTVVYPHQCALGGDLAALVRTPDGEVTAVLGIGAAPAGMPVGTAGVFAQGARSVTVPGLVSGWTALAGWSRLGLRPALHHAADLAEDGATVSSGLAQAIQDRWAAVSADPGLRALLTDGSRALLPPRRRCANLRSRPRCARSPPIPAPSTAARSPTRCPSSWAGRSRPMTSPRTPSR